MSSEEMQFFDQLKPVFSEEDKRKLRVSARKSGMQTWRWSYGLQAMAIGGVSGMIQTTDISAICGIVAIDLTELLILSFNAAFGIGHIIDKNEVLYGDDLLGILSVWTGIGEAVSILPAGKFGLKLSVKSLSTVGPTLVSKFAYKAALKTNGKFVAKLGSKVLAKMATKVATKVATKEGVKQVISNVAPWIGGITSLGINCLIINEIMDASLKYYSNPYLQLDNDLEGLAST